VEPEEAEVPRQRLDKEVSAATDTHAEVEELFEAVFSMLSLPRLYSEGHQEKLVSE
jgi:hypothetical protein